jgi:hypothetical protein
MTSLQWKLNRLRLMGFPEIVYRTRQQVQKKAFRLGIGAAYQPTAPKTSVFGKAFISTTPVGIDRATLCAAAEDLLAGRWNVFSLRSVELGFPPEWNRDPKTGTVAPLDIGKSMDYRDERIVGDIKYLWEPSRHLGVVTLAAAWRVTKDLRYAEGAATLLTSWMDQCPYPKGVHWASSLELAVRLLNWSVAWHLFGGEDSILFHGEAGAVFKRRWLDCIYQHCHFIDGFYSRHSSANNHLFGEYMGLFIAALTWPCWKESAGWQAKAKAGLEVEGLGQTAPDGVNREQAVYYHHEVMDMMLITHLAGAANGVKFSSSFMERLERMADFLRSLMDVGGNVPMFGDADDALMVCLSHQPGWCHYRSLLAACAVLFDRPDLKHAAGALDDKNRWLFGEEGVRRWAAMTQELREPVLQFPVGGYYLLGRDWGTPREIKAVLDCAPLGYLSIAAHGHADSLSMVVSAGGEELLIDPGTYAYHTQKKWRDYFRSTAAHNTVRVDGLDQSVIGGNFMWLHKAKSTLTKYLAHEDGQVFEGAHDGYCRLGDPVIHRRKIEFNAERSLFVITDSLVCKGKHQIEILWHIGEKCSVVVDDGKVTVTSGSDNVHMTIAALGLHPVLKRADEQEPSGWISRTFDHKQPTTTLCYATAINGTVEFQTEIGIRFQPAPFLQQTTALERRSEGVAEHAPDN